MSENLILPPFNPPFLNLKDPNVQMQSEELVKILGGLKLFCNLSVFHHTFPKEVTAL